MIPFPADIGGLKSPFHNDLLVKIKVVRLIPATDGKRYRSKIGCPEHKFIHKVF